MDIIHDIPTLRQRLQHAQGIAFVPTMGNLHQGHMHLVQQAVALRQQGLVDTIVASVFVNRLQFAPDEDFDTYPRTLDADADKLRAHGCDVVFAPSEEQLYPQPQAFHVQPPASLDGILEGHFRPGFFRGVCTVVHKLFNIVQPQHAIFGKKDYQQLAVIRQMVEHMALPVQIHGADIVRDAHGLALSSRNGYFDEQQLEKARELNACLREVKAKLIQSLTAQTPASQLAQRCRELELSAKLIQSLTAQAPAPQLAQRCKELELAAVQQLTDAGWQVDYVTMRHAVDLQPLSQNSSSNDNGTLVLLAAATLQGVRLIDNLEVELQL